MAATRAMIADIFHAVFGRGMYACKKKKRNEENGETKATRRGKSGKGGAECNDTMRRQRET